MPCGRTCSLEVNRPFSNVRQKTPSYFGDNTRRQKHTTLVSNKRSFSRAFHQPMPSSPLRSQASTPTDSSRTGSGESIGGPEHSPVRDREIVERCKERDHGLCVVSRISSVDACHLYPWCAFGGKDPDRVGNFWDILRMFWPKDKVDL